MFIFKVRGKANDETRKPLTGCLPSSEGQLRPECCLQIRMIEREIKLKINIGIILSKRA